MSAALRGAYLAIAESAALVGSLQIRNLATLGGNLANAAPSADMAPPLLALDAEVVIAGPGGQRRVPIADFFTGVRQTVLAPNEMLVEIVVPVARRAQRRHSTCATRRGASSTSPSSASPRSSRSTTAAASKRASRWRRWRRLPLRATAAELASKARPSRPS